MSTISCNDPRTYDQYRGVSLQGWLRNDTLTFDIPRQWEGNYQLDLCLRAARTYPYRNISMIIERKVINYKQRKKQERTYNDTVNCEIVNDKGTLVGQKGITSTEIRQPITSFQLNRNAPYMSRYTISWAVSPSQELVMLVSDFLRNK